MHKVSSPEWSYVQYLKLIWTLGAEQFTEKYPHIFLQAFLNIVNSNLKIYFSILSENRSPVHSEAKSVIIKR